MQHDILDDFEAIEATEKKEKFEWKKWFPIFLLWVGAWGCRSMIFSLYPPFVLAFIGLVLGTLLCYFYWNKGVIFLCALLVLASLKLIFFFSYSLSVGRGMFDLIPFILCCILYLQNPRFISEEQKAAAKRAEFEEQIKRYKYGFRDKNQAELEEKLINDNISVAAKQAAQELLNEKTKENES